MRFDEITMYGPFRPEIVVSLPTYSATRDDKRLLYVEDTDNTTMQVYIGDSQKEAWRRIDFPYDELTGDDIYVAYDGDSFYLTKALPDQTNNSKKFLQTNGKIATWQYVDVNDKTVLPNQKNKDNQFLRTNGASVYWSVLPSELPDKTSNGEILSVNFSASDDTDLEWIDVSDALGLPDKTDHSLEVLRVNSAEDDIEWADPFPTYTGSDDRYLKYDGTTRSWSELNVMPDPDNPSALITDGTTISGSEAQLIPDQNDNEGNLLTTNGTRLSWTDVTDQIWIKTDTTWYVPTNYATLELAISALDDYYVHPNATLTIQLEDSSHNVAGQIKITSRGLDEGNIVIAGNGISSTTLTSSDYGAFNTGESLIYLVNSKIILSSLKITGDGTTSISGLHAAQHSTLTLSNVNVNTFDENIEISRNSLGFFGTLTSTASTSRSLSIIHNSHCYLSGSTITNNTGTGIHTSSLSETQMLSSTVSFNNIGVLAQGNSSILSYSNSSIINNTIGVQCSDNSTATFYIEGTGTSIIDNSTGIYCRRLSTVNASNITLSNTLDIKGEDVGLILNYNGSYTTSELDSISIIKS